ncbi:MAG: 2Fe-2S iron-sulfur cluster binding domain-containing protein [Flavobacteriaceae bacterium]|jgi:2Fe-2S ferredoxin|nr:2Fe-2S iron-sulfur cluster binding domain-containing protein [Flavobacteriaceae bacterium]
MSYINISIIDREGKEHQVQTPTDMSMNLMELIRAYELAEEGTIGVCGGMAMCASCQIYILSGDIPLPEMGAEEDAMLAEARFVQENSRLSCQIPIKKELDGLKIQLAPAE